MINFFIKTYGCQANAADSQAVSNYLQDLGCHKVESREDADLILINTCAIREKAEQKVFSYIGELAPLKIEKKHLQVGIIGCIASYRKKELLSRFDHVRFVYGAKDEQVGLQNLLNDVVLKLETVKALMPFETLCSSGRTGEGETVKSSKPCELVNESAEQRVKNKLFLGGFKSAAKEVKQSFVNIMTGCNNYCSYCIVPFTRGREVSYSMSEILDRVKRDIELGAKEITLLGQNVNSYKDPQTGATFSKLLEEVAKLEGEFWVKFFSPHPKDMTIDVLEVMAKYNKLCNYIHFPVQAGSNKILQAMNRTYSVEKYLEQVDWIHKILPDAMITTDIIVGFPGEIERDYLATREVMEKVKFDYVFSFVYSPRKYTKAALLQDDCSTEIKHDRLAALQKRQVEISRERNNQLIGKKLKCLVEKRLTNGKLLARTEGNVRVLFDGDDSKIGQFVLLNIDNAGAVNLVGSLI